MVCHGDAHPSGTGRGLPQELLPRVLALVPVAEFFRAAASTCRQFSSSWYLAQFEQKVVVPDDVHNINAAINRLSSDGRCGSYGLVLVRPGTYPESVRVTRNCYILGLGRRGSVVVEAPGWESALVFAGLGVRGFGSGEDACVINLTFRCRNELMQGRCLYIVMGQPRVEHCCVDGGVLIGGSCTAPQIHDCRISKSRGSGLHLTDHCQGIVKGSTVVGHKRHGVLVDRHARPVIAQNSIVGNHAYGIRVFQGEDCCRPDNSLVGAIQDNVLCGNGAGEVSLTPRNVDIEENVLDFDLPDSD